MPIAINQLATEIIFRRGAFFHFVTRKDRECSVRLARALNGFLVSSIPLITSCTHGYMRLCECAQCLLRM